MQPGNAATTASFPTRPVVFVVPYSPGSVADLWARMISPKLSKMWGQPVLVENRPGGSAQIAMAHVKNSKPDGHTLLLGSLSTSMAKLTNSKMAYDPQIEFLPVYKYLSFRIIFATNDKTYENAKSLNELAEYSQSTTNGIFSGDGGVGTTFNMALSFVLKDMNFKYEAVSFNSFTDMSLALLRNDVQVIMNTPAVLKTYLQEKTMYPLAALAESRYSEWPELPTVREAGYEGFLPEIWNGVFAPKGTPVEVLDKISEDIDTVSMDPEMKKKIESTFSATIPRGGRAAFEKYLIDETKQWENVLNEINFKPL